MLQNLLCLWKKNPCSFFCFSFRATFIFPFMNALGYVDIDQGIHKVKVKVAQNEKWKKLLGFSFSINIANLEAFLRTKKLISNLFFWRLSKYVNIGDWSSLEQDNLIFFAESIGINQYWVGLKCTQLRPHLSDFI